MTHSTDPFAHHPELRDRITPTHASFFRDFTLDKLVDHHPEMAHMRGWAHSDATREALRADALADHEGDLWIFAYGSLMWDPALVFQEVRRVHAPGVARRFILCDDKGARGSKQAPGLMAALDHGTGCDGLAYRIAADDVHAETRNLFRRELIGPAYIPAHIPVLAGDAQMTALTFLADPTCPDILGAISRADQIRMIATGAGVLGSSLDYLRNVTTQLAELGIDDPACTDLLHAVEAYTARTGP